MGGCREAGRRRAGGERAASARRRRRRTLQAGRTVYPALQRRLGTDEGGLAELAGSELSAEEACAGRAARGASRPLECSERTCCAVGAEGAAGTRQRDEEASAKLKKKRALRRCTSCLTRAPPSEPLTAATPNCPYVNTVLEQP